MEMARDARDVYGYRDFAKAHGYAKGCLRALERTVRVLDSPQARCALLQESKCGPSELAELIPPQDFRSFVRNYLNLRRVWLPRLRESYPSAREALIIARKMYADPVHLCGLWEVFGHDIVVQLAEGMMVHADELGQAEMASDDILLFLMLRVPPPGFQWAVLARDLPTVARLIEEERICVKETAQNRNLVLTIYGASV